MKRLIFLVAVVLTAALAYGQSVERMKAFYNEGKILYNQWDLRGAANKWEPALGIAKSIKNEEWEAFLLNYLGIVYWNLGDYPKAISYYEQALKIKREIGDRKGEGDDLANLVVVYENLGDYPKVISYYEKALKIQKEIGDKKGIGDNLLNLGVVYWNLGDYPKAIFYYEQALKIKREIGDRKGERADLTNLGIVYDNLGDYPKAISYYEQALKINREIGEKKGIGDNLGNLGVVYGNLCNYPKAISYFEQALKIFREIGDRKGEGADLANLGAVYRNLGDYPKAISYHEQALKIYREIEDRKGEGADLTNLGVVYMDLGDYPKAISYYEQALKIDREIGDKKGIGNNLTNLGAVYQNLGDYPKAISYHEQAMKIDREIGDRKGEGSDLNCLGVVYWNLGDYPKAISYYEQALKIKREIGDKKGIGNNLTNLGVVYQNLGDYPKAISYHERALKIYREIGDKKGEGADLSNLGVVYSRLGDYPKAISYYEQALKIDREIGVPTRREEANIADVWLKMGEIEKAEETYLKLGVPIRLGKLHLVRQNYGKAVEYFDKSLKEDLQRRNATFLFADYTGLGQSYEGLKEYDKAKQNYENAVTMTEEQREVLAEAEKSKFFVAEIYGFKRIQSYEGMVRVSIDMDSPGEGFFYSENLKSRLLSEAIAKGHSSVVKKIPYDLKKDEENYLTKIRGLRKGMDALYKNDAMDMYYEKEKELKSIKEEQGKFISTLRQLYPEYASINYPQPIKSSEVNLRENEALIEFEVTDEKTYVFLLKGGKIKIREVPISRKELQYLVIKYRGYFEGISSFSDLFSYRPEIGNKLFSLLFGNILDDIAENTSIIIVPDEFLGILPFEALVIELPEIEKIGEGEYGSFPLGVKYLGDKYMISYAQSATSLTLLRALKKDISTKSKAFAVCDPIFSLNDRRVRKKDRVNISEQNINMMGAIGEWKKMGIAGIMEKGEKRRKSIAKEEIFPRFEKTGEIAKGIKKLFGRNSTILIGEKANEKDIVELDLSKYKYITFATHGILDKTVPYIKEPALVLTQVGNSEEYDGFLTMSEIMGLKMNAEVVALIACETGVGENIRGEGVMGMGRAFQYAGCSNVLMSLWSVAEDATVSLSNEFFKNLKEGKEPKEALRLARAEIRRKGYEHPFYWSAFILFSN